MKRMFLSLVGGWVFAMLMLNACANKVAEVIPGDKPKGDITDVVFIAGGFDESNGVQSRVDYVISDNGTEKSTSFVWALGDTIGILPEEASQVYFKIQEIDANDPKKALFSGVAWGLKAGIDYAAYYPFIGDIYLKRTQVPVDYSVQSCHHSVNQEGKVVVSPSHNYQAARPVEREDGGLNFEFKHLGGLIEVQFTLPDRESGTIKRFEWIADEAIFPVKGTFNLNDTPVAILADEEKLSRSVTVNVTGLTAEAGRKVSVFFMMPPMTCMDVSSLKASVVYGEDDTRCPLAITNLKDRMGADVTSLQAAKYYILRTEETEQPETIVVDRYSFSSNINEALGILGGTKLRFVAGSSVVSETMVYSDYNGVMAYAVRNGDWLEVHTLAKSFQLNFTSSMFDADDYGNFDKLTSIDLRGLDTSNVIYMYDMFHGCSSLKELSFGKSFKTCSVKRMDNMFHGCSSLTALDLSGFDTSNVTDMNNMFCGCSVLTALDLSDFDTSNVTDMSLMFYGCSGLKVLDLSNFDTSNVTDMNNMFCGCSSLTELDLCSFDTSNVTDMSGMFSLCSGLTELDLRGFDTSNVTNMSSMFGSCSGLTELNLCSFDTSDVTDMWGMFSSCSGLTSLTFGEGFKTSSVMRMTLMFDGCSDLAALDLSGFDTSKVTDMGNMFAFCSDLKALDVTNFTFVENGDFDNLFTGVGRSVYEETGEKVVITIASDYYAGFRINGNYYFWYYRYVIADAREVVIKQSTN